MVRFQADCWSPLELKDNRIRLKVKIFFSLDILQTELLRINIEIKINKIVCFLCQFKCVVFYIGFYGAKTCNYESGLFILFGCRLIYWMMPISSTLN